jgi:hypothetical protein
MRTDSKRQPNSKTKAETTKQTAKPNQMQILEHSNECEHRERRETKMKAISQVTATAGVAPPSG